MQLRVRRRVPLFGKSKGPGAPPTSPGMSLAPIVHSASERTFLQLQCSCSRNIRFGSWRMVPRWAVIWWAPGGWEGALLCVMGALCRGGEQAFA